MSTDRRELEKVWPLVARVAIGALAGKGLLESQSTSSVQKVAPFTSSRKRHDDALGSGPSVEKTFHDDIDEGADFADAAKLVGSVLLGAYLGRKVGKKAGGGLARLSERLSKTVDYQQATTWPQQKSIAGDIGSRVGRTAGEAVGKKFSKQGNPFAIATSQAKKMGYDDFSEGSTGRKKRGEIAEAIKGIDNMNKSDDPMVRLLKAVEGLKEGFVDGGQAGKPYTDSSKNIDTPKKKSELLPKDRQPPEGYMLKKECTCHG